MEVNLYSTFGSLHCSSFFFFFFRASSSSMHCLAALDFGAGAEQPFGCLIVPSAGASTSPQECDAWCQLLPKWLKVSAIRERPVQCYSEVFGLGAEGQGSLLYLTFSSRLASLLLKWKAADTIFVVLSFSFRVWLYSPTVDQLSKKVMSAWSFEILQCNTFCVNSNNIKNK